jgi:peptide deformylase
MTEIIKVHYKLSRTVESYGQIKDEAEALLDFIDHAKLKGFYNKAYAISHAQVSETPYAFFVVSNEMIRDKQFPARVIINPEILASPIYKQIGGMGRVPNSFELREPCLSFPYREPKRITRYDAIKVSYRIPTFWGLKTITQDLIGIPSAVFQHEYDHAQAKNIYFESDSAIKWWELDGKRQGVELDEKLAAMTPASEHERVDILGEELSGRRSTPPQL